MGYSGAVTYPLRQLVVATSAWPSGADTLLIAESDLTDLTPT